jgi:ligand-binding sensor domain-containing protein
MRALLLFFLVGLSGITHAQKYPILHYTTQDGLSQMQVMSTFRDSRGYLWVGTNYGFCKFNGESFERFIPDFKAVGRAVSNFAEDSKGIMYIESEQMGRFNGQQFVEIKKTQALFFELCIDNHDQVFCRNSTTGELNTVLNDSLVVVQWPSLKKSKVKVADL